MCSGESTEQYKWDKTTELRQKIVIPKGGQEDRSMNTFRWLKEKNSWNLNELEYYIASEFSVAFSAKSSYYDLFREAGISWKKSQKKNPSKDPEAVAKKKKKLTSF